MIKKLAILNIALLIALGGALMALVPELPFLVMVGIVVAVLAVAMQAQWLYVFLHG